MRKNIVFLLIVLISCIFPVLNVFAGDIPESVLGVRNADVIIGVIKDITDTQTVIEIDNALFEVITDKDITLDNFMYLSDYRERGLPEIGDFCAVAVIKEDDGSYTLYSGLCAKADSLDAETLKLESVQPFVERMNIYINDGHYSKRSREEYFPTTEESVATPDNTVENQAGSEIDDVFLADSNYQETAYTDMVEAEQEQLPGNGLYFVVVPAICITVFGWAYYKNSRKIKKEEY